MLFLLHHSRNVRAAIYATRSTLKPYSEVCRFWIAPILLGVDQNAFIAYASP